MQEQTEQEFSNRRPLATVWLVAVLVARDDDISNNDNNMADGHNVQLSPFTSLRHGRGLGKQRELEVLNGGRCRI